MRFRPALLAVLIAVAAPPALGQSMSAYDDQRAGYVQRDDREIGSVLEFEVPLARYGNWVPSRYGRAWHPRVSADWRPYTVGRWVVGPDGETWQSDEPWGWATYHYGRWGFDDRWGWVWVPDIEWAPAWGAWRDGDQYSGWAPLPPRSGYGSFGTGYDVDAWDYSQWYAPSWIYVPRASLYRRNIGSVALPWRSGRNYWNVTRGTRRSDDGRSLERRGFPARGVGGQDGYGRGPGRPNWTGRPAQGGGYPNAVRPQDSRFQGRPGIASSRPDRSQPDQPQFRPERDRQPGYGQGAPRLDRRPGYVSLGANPGQPQPGVSGGGRDRLGYPARERGVNGRGGGGAGGVAPGGAPVSPAAERPRPGRRRP